MSYRVAMDIGGTFTDVVCYDERTGAVTASKAPTTPGDLAEGVFAALGRVVDDPAEISFFVHGTTQGLNALLERKGARVLLLASEGGGDVYQIARGNRDRMFDLRYRKPVPLVPRQDVMEAGGRLDYLGREFVPLDEASVRAAARRAREEGFDAVAVCLLFAYANPAHEARAGEILREELGEGVLVVLSHEVAREWREYERTSSAVLEAYTGPVVRRYLARVERRFAERGLAVPVHVMQSSGGLVNASYAMRRPLQTLLSGPVGGTMGGVAATRLLRGEGARGNAICIDMGGTSFDVSLVVNGRPDVSAEARIEGYPVLMPIVNLHTIGAGGGSIAYAEAGALRVGPESAGAVPGPACYGRGGTRPTVTDANVALGRVDPAWFAGGLMELDAEAAGEAVATLAGELDLDPLLLAEGICDVANAKMAQAIRTLTVEHGIEPREFALVAFGGAGPMHAAFIARELGISEVVVPRFPGAFSAWGMLEADVRRDLTHPYFRPQDTLNRHDMSRNFGLLEEEALTALSAQGVPEDRRRVEHAVDMRYEGQDYTLTIPLRDAAEPAEPGFLETIAARYAEAHTARYGHATPEAPVEFVMLRSTGFGSFPRTAAAPAQAPEERAERVRDVIFDGAVHSTPVLRRAGLDGELAGPAIVVEETATTVIPPGCVATVDPNGFLIVKVNP
ncbi:hydantoinase/oxoprolinase family protein [Nonomuraea phyllanthi]|uniref:Hydantoinase/oxoprolinase family protein n=1 Tax=Nonomuraea phyllanthi TaxID=2219224 RepID=A0A5C4WQY1_9ACTN|nr:hydantoinase/oxoprolinase family protein [Nonomuraea phyllanthi]KAB8195272.1 hydantoinase/oxoprolinase family protein [Nonomuraea phyllanthi]QFY10597.1 hydantoinase/oxoprolinase family protein [Nonomuraea phyllanthi]